ncbi:uncharacterized protein P884DRAFT_257042 [Thermothelomyces heterothallicus CBS 202.75]|uniref:uncharacterized protein n=1 Tax=Thermothelomyces heterothallicus CBS 202.75 TaxID=1149848 RepID=UPI0037449788
MLMAVLVVRLILRRKVIGCCAIVAEASDAQVRGAVGADEAEEEGNVYCGSFFALLGYQTSRYMGRCDVPLLDLKGGVGSEYQNLSHMLLLLLLPSFLS